MRTLESTLLHFDLSHCPQSAKFSLIGGDGKKHYLTAYADAPGKFQQHQGKNRALAALPAHHHDKITHFLEDVPMPRHQSSMRQVVYDSLDDHPLPEIAMSFIHIPEIAHRRPLHHKAAKRPAQPHTVFQHYGVDLASASEAEIEQLHTDAYNIKPPYETARAIIFQHPEIGSVNPAVTKYVFDYHVNNTQDFQSLISYVQINGPGSPTCWYKKSWVMWTNPDTNQEEPVPANMDLDYKDGSKPDWPTNPDTGEPSIPNYELTDEYSTGSAADTGVIGAATPAVQQVLKLTKNDEVLNGQLWTAQNGTTERAETEVPPNPPSLAADAVALAVETDSADATGFGIKNITSSYGLYLYDSELKYDYDSKKLSFPVKNWPSRYLSLYVEFYKQDGTPIKRVDIKDWDDPLPDFLRSAFEPSDSKNYLDWISSGNAIFGVPVPPLTGKTDVEFQWPEEASSARVLLGGLGCANGFKDWDSDVDIVGVLGTGIVNYGITVLSTLLSVYIVNPFISGLKGDAKIAFYIVCGFGGSVAAILGGLEYKTNAGKAILSKLGNIASSIIFGVAVQKILQQVYKQAIEKIIAETVAEITAEEALGQIPVAGWALKVASIAADLAALSATTVECVLSPATYSLEVQHTLDLNVTVKPDPRHGTEEQAPIWPLVADHYVIQVKYPKGDGKEGGTTFTKAGPMPGQHDAPIEVTFEKIPAGGKIEVVASVYSSNDWLAGVYNSGWINADPDRNDQLAVTGAILEKLVPLTADTSYSQKQTLAYSDSRQHYWEVTQFSISADLASDLDKGGNPDEAVRAAFAENGNDLSSDALVTVVTAGSQWTLADNDAGVNFAIDKKQIYSGDGTTHYELEVQNTTNPAPGLPAVLNDCANDGHRICDRMDITINNKEYQLGYAWRASGQNLPRDYGSAKENGQMYSFQSISTLAEPQDAIIEPSRGFSNPSFIAYDQFGLTDLFELDYDSYRETLNSGGPVPEALAKEFAGYSLPLPDNATITVVTSDQDWTIGAPDEEPEYELVTQRVVRDGEWVSVIGVFSYPVPKLDNFYLDSRTYTEENQLYYLRGVSFKPGVSTFDYDQTKAWGSFQDVTIKGMAVHPEGYVIGVDYDNHKLLALRLPGEAVANEESPVAMPLSGEGLREGLLDKPVALTITSAGRILILEEGNERIQAFDVKGNAVPCFTVGQETWEMPLSFVSELDSREPGTDMVQEFQKNVLPARAPCFTTDTSPVDALDQGQVDDSLSADFVNNGYASGADANPVFTVTVTEAGKLWLVTDQDSGAVFDVRVLPDQYQIPYLFIYRAFSLGVTVNAKGLQWEVSDTINAMNFRVVKPQSGNLQVTQLVALMPLRQQTGKDISYLDIAVEDKGYIYVLMKANGSSPEFMLDIYNPDGSVLLTEPQTGVNAAKLTVDQWRNMFTLNYTALLGPGQRTEPGISTWIPSTPGEPDA
ncbi:hypothetical protein ACJJIF_03750 [Microbulbifer sp. SSSA002]|uniref:hypothetical protein n=1 Tax=Microbulbifer sp. SSSA002 TaxID=3243376 RepID=UPI0040394508